MGSFVWHVREGSFGGPELAGAYRYHPFSVDEPHVGTDDVFLEGAGAVAGDRLPAGRGARVRRHILVVERASAI